LHVQPHEQVAGGGNCSAARSGPPLAERLDVSMADTYNLGWKLAAVLQGRTPASLLHTYNQERRGIAEDLIATDKRWSKAIGAAQVDPSNPHVALIGMAEVQRQFITNLDFTAGMATNYDPGPLIGDTHLPGLGRGLRTRPPVPLRRGDPAQRREEAAPGARPPGRRSLAAVRLRRRRRPAQPRTSTSRSPCRWTATTSSTSSSPGS
jgi:hypothetical protein